MKATIRSANAGAALTVAMLIALGCAAKQPTPSEIHFGESFRQLRAEQIANPDAGRDSTPVEGLQAGEAEGVVEYYRERQKSDYQNTPRDAIVGEDE